MKDLLDELAKDHNESLNKLKEVPERESKIDRTIEVPDFTFVKGGLNRKDGKARKRTWDEGNYYGYYG